MDRRAMYWAIIDIGIGLCFPILAGLAFLITEWRNLCIVLGSLEIVLVLLLAM